MATLPIYEPTLTFAPQPLTSSANVWNALSTTIDQIEKPIEQTLKQKQKDALGMQRLQLGQDILKSSNALLQKANTNNDKQVALGQFRFGWQDYANGFIKNVPEANKVYAKRLLIHYGLKGQQDIEARIAAQGKFLAQEEADDIYKVHLAAAKNYASSHNANSQKNSVYELGQIRSMMTDLTGNKIYSPSKAATMDEAAKTQVEIERIGAAYRVALQEGEKAALLFRKKIADLPEIPGINKKTIFSRLDTIDKLQLVKTGRNKEQIDSIRKNILFQLSIGNMASASEIGTVREAYPDKFDDFMKKAELAAEMGQKLKEGQSGSMPGLLNAVAEAEKPLTPEEAKSPDAVQRAAAKKQLGTSLKNRATLAIQDPVAYIEADPGFQANNEELRDKMLNADPGSPEWFGQYNRYQQARDDLMISTLMAKGYDRSHIKIISAQQGAAMKEFYNNISPEEIPKQLEYLRLRYGKNLGLALRNLQDYGVKQADIHYLSGAGNPDSAPDIYTILSQLKVGEKGLLQTAKETRSDFLESLLTTDVQDSVLRFANTLDLSHGDMTDYMTNMRQMVRVGALALMAAHPDISQTIAVERAGAALIHNQVQYFTYRRVGGLLTPFVGGSSLRAPKGLPISTIKEGLDAMAYKINKDVPKDLKIPGHMRFQFSDLTGKEVRTIYVPQGYRAGTFVNNSQDTGYWYVDNQGIVARHETGNVPVAEVHYDDFLNPDSEVYKAMAEMAPQIIKEEKKLKLGIPLTLEEEQKRFLLGPHPLKIGKLFNLGAEAHD